jgi:hypothetical protein
VTAHEQQRRTALPDYRLLGGTTAAFTVPVSAA